MADFDCQLEHDEKDPGIVIKVHYTFEPWMTANRIHALLEDLGRKTWHDYHTKAVIEEMRRTESKQLYVKIGFREPDEEDQKGQEDEGCTRK